MKRNKLVVIICFIAIALSALYVAKSISNNRSSSNSSSEEYFKIKNTYEVMFENLKSKKDYEDLKQDLQDDINGVKLLKLLSQDEILVVLDECINVGKLNVSNISFSEIRQINLNNENESMDYTLEAKSSFPIEVINVHIEFNSTYDDLILFVDKIQGYKTEISITNISILNGEEGEMVYCTIDLSFYAI